MMAARATAPEGSTTIFILSHISLIAEMISSSSTLIMALTRLLMMGKLRSPREVLKTVGNGYRIYRRLNYAGLQGPEGIIGTEWFTCI